MKECLSKKENKKAEVKYWEWVWMMAILEKIYFLFLFFFPAHELLSKARASVAVCSVCRVQPALKMEHAVWPSYSQGQSG